MKTSTDILKLANMKSLLKAAESNVCRIKNREALGLSPRARSSYWEQIARDYRTEIQQLTIQP